MQGSPDGHPHLMDSPIIIWEGVHFPDSCLLIVLYTERFVVLPGRSLQPLDLPFFSALKLLLTGFTE